METELGRGYSGTARRKGRQQTNRTYCHRATSRLYRVVVVDGDQVLCPCKKNRVIAGSNPGIFLNITDEAATASSATAAHTSRGLSQRANGFDEQVQPVARGAAVQDYPYYILAGDGRIFSGRVDASGRLPRIDAQSAGDYTVYWGDDALAKQQGN